MAAKFFGFGRWFSPKRALPTVSIKTQHRFRCLRGFELLESRCFLAIGTLATVTPEVWLPLDEGSINIAADYSGHARNATVFGASWTTGRSGTGLSFDGQSNYVNANLDLSRWLGGTGALCFWLLTTQTGNDNFSLAPGIAGFQQPDSNNAIGWGWLDSMGHIHVGAGATAASGRTINDGKWHCIVMTRDATSGLEQVFVDGALDGSAVGRTGGITSAFTGIGRIENGAGPANYFAGELDDIQIYSQILSASQAQKLFKKGPASHGSHPPAPAVSQDSWTRQENARIDQIRKGNAEVHVVDQFGNPVTNVVIDAREIQSQFPFGSAINGNVLVNPQYAAFLQSHFSWAAMEDESTWYFNEPTQGNVTYSVADAIASYAAANHITLRGPALFWGDPTIIQPWLQRLSTADLLAAVQSRLQSAVTHFDGTFAQWTVNNETLHAHFFDSRLGSSILPWMFQQVRALDPDVPLFVNDYNTIEGNDTAAYKAEIQWLLSQGAPIDGIGVQGHFVGSINPKDVESRLNSLGQLGLPIWITEFDTVNADPNKRANQMEALYREAFSNPNVDGILMWGFWAGAQWRGPNASMVNLDWTLNADGQRYDDLMHEWTTIADGATNSGGNLDFRGFAGTYDITVTGPNGQTTVSRVTLNPGTSTSQFTVAINLSAPVAVTKVTATGGKAQVSLSWAADSGASSYSILRGTTPGGEGSVPIQIGIFGTNFTDTHVVSGTTYYYQVIAVNGAGTSPPSAEVVATTRSSSRLSKDDLAFTNTLAVSSEIVPIDVNES
jgi:GH35 family endo-1,4-beta-xylanase